MFILLNYLFLDDLVSILQNYQTYIFIWLSLKTFFQICRGFENEKFNNEHIEKYKKIRIHIRQVDMLNNKRERDHKQIRQLTNIIVLQ